MLAGKRDSRRHSTTSFNKNVVVAEKSYQMLEVLSFCDQERDYPPLIKKTVLTFQVKKSTIKLSGIYPCKKLSVISLPRSRSPPRI